MGSRPSERAEDRGVVDIRQLGTRSVLVVFALLTSVGVFAAEPVGAAQADATPNGSLALLAVQQAQLTAAAGGSLTERSQGARLVQDPGQHAPCSGCSCCCSGCHRRSSGSTRCSRSSSSRRNSSSRRTQNHRTGNAKTFRCAGSAPGVCSFAATNGRPLCRF